MSKELLEKSRNAWENIIEHTMETQDVGEDFVQLSQVRFQ
jgi:hypothetical protein